MELLFPSASGLTGVIACITSSNPTRACVKEFANLCHQIATGYLRKKVSLGRLDCNFFALSIDDLAFDCISGLFRRDERGSFTQIEAYFHRLLPANPSDADLLAATRRLVFSSVNHELYRLYKQHDPTLAKLIRNIKNALKFSTTLFVDQARNEIWLKPFHNNGECAYLPSMPPEFLELHLSQLHHKGSTLKNVLAAFAGVLRDQKIYRKGYSLVGLALLIRTLFYDRGYEQHESGSDETSLCVSELESILQASAKCVRSRVEDHYVETGKTSKAMYDLYVEVANEFLGTEYFQENGKKRVSLYEMLKARHVTMTRDDYRKDHRVRVEYLVKMIRKDFLRNVKGEIV